MLSQLNCTNIKDILSEFVWPTRCVGCDKFGFLLCADCFNKMPWIEQKWACCMCGAPWGWMACSECKNKWLMDCCVSSCLYEGVARKMVICMKDEYEVRLSRLIALSIAKGLNDASLYKDIYGRSRFDRSRIDCICFIPATKSSYARRGFDHMQLIAKDLSDILKLDMLDILVRDTPLDQRGLSKSQRQKNMRGTIEVVGGVENMNILLIDDVITTGATLNAASDAFYQRGANSVVAASFCRAI